MRLLRIESLPTSKNWVDADFQMLHACFQILQDFIDIEKGDDHCCYEAQKSFVDEVRFLYDWWQDRKKKVFHDGENDDKMMLRLMTIRKQLWT